MNRIDFSDINKFITSIGLLLVIVGLLLPWYISSYYDLLVLDKETMKNLTDVARRTLIDEQYFVLWLHEHMKCLMFWLISIGLIIMIFGLLRWNKRQKVQYGLQDEELRIKKQQGITEEDREKKIKQEIDQQNQGARNQGAAGTPRVTKSAIDRYMEIEDLVFLKLSTKYTVNYNAKQNIRINNQEFDIILESKQIEKRADFIFEVKYYKRRLSSMQYRAAARRLMLSITEYRQTLQRHSVIPVLLFIYAEHSLKNENSKLSDELTKFAQDFGYNNFRLIEISEDELSDIEPEKLLKR